MAKLNEKGHEVLDDTPVAIPVRFQRPENLTDQIRRVIRQEMSRVADFAGMETFEEADDFNVPDDEYDPRSPHELSLDQELEGYGGNEDGAAGRTGPDKQEPGGSGGSIPEDREAGEKPPEKEGGGAREVS
jgi:hypothetical protein